MSEIKKIEPLTGWIELHLGTDVIEPPVLRVRLRPLAAIDVMDTYAEGGQVRAVKISEVTAAAALRAIADWDLTQAGQPLPCTDEIKSDPGYRDFFKVLLSARVQRRLGPGEGEEDAESSEFAALEILRLARTTELFLKN